MWTQLYRSATFLSDGGRIIVPKSISIICHYIYYSLKVRLEYMGFTAEECLVF